MRRLFMTLVHPFAIPVRWTLIADAVVCAVLGLLALGTAGPIADLTDLPVTLLRVAGILLVPYVIYLAVIVRRNLISPATVRVAVIVNLFWAAGSFAVLFSDRVEPNATGITFILVQAVGVLIFAALQHLGEATSAA
jgi:hypothetical protein